ncbi:MAG: hypothetical protein HYX21_03405 [Candidatus Yanofskybacteria bacterium]|nr:hypothetical protein [Candidatus Yanofskybacteria bacterium]
MSIEKRKQAEEVLFDLCRKCSATPVLEVLLDLRDLHNFYKLPVWLEDENGCNVFSGIVKNLASKPKKQSFSIVEANFLASMLLWPELQEYADSNSRLAILYALENSSFHAIFATLAQHMEFLSSVYVREPATTHRSAALGKELEMIRRLILKCGSGTESLVAENRRRVEEKKKENKDT